MQKHSHSVMQDPLSLQKDGGQAPNELFNNRFRHVLFNFLV